MFIFIAGSRCDIVSGARIQEVEAAVLSNTGVSPAGGNQGWGLSTKYEWLNAIYPLLKYSQIWATCWLEGMDIWIEMRVKYSSHRLKDWDCHNGS